jgi:transposase
MVDVNDDASGGGYRRVEVLTGPGRRRRWSEEAKARIVAETLAAGVHLAAGDAAQLHALIRADRGGA